MGFLDLMPLDIFLENSALSTFIFNQNEVTLSEIFNNFDIDKIRLKNKIKEMVKLNLITIKKIAEEHDLKIIATDKLSFLILDKLK
ncbi:hypothetical protein LCGC14_1828950 [marine sediment metagenome]|uniref:Uncharacterized protein n=1 Tax=marine sediment metagenome TaxID=412755 RepID=A0A0F9GGW9_9ZZZZ|nr:hypothetical protein [archaeon]